MTAGAAGRFGAGFGSPRAGASLWFDSAPSTGSGQAGRGRRPGSSRTGRGLLQAERGSTRFSDGLRTGSPRTEGGSARTGAGGRGAGPGVGRTGRGSVRTRRGAGAEAAGTGRRAFGLRVAGTAGLVYTVWERKATARWPAPAKGAPVCEPRPGDGRLAGGDRQGGLPGVRPGGAVAEAACRSAGLAADLVHLDFAAAVGVAGFVDEAGAFLGVAVGARGPDALD